MAQIWGPDKEDPANRRLRCQYLRHAGCRSASTRLSGPTGTLMSSYRFRLKPACDSLSKARLASVHEPSSTPCEVGVYHHVREDSTTHRRVVEAKGKLDKTLSSKAKGPGGHAAAKQQQCYSTDLLRPRNYDLRLRPRVSSQASDRGALSSSAPSHIQNLTCHWTATCNPCS